MRPVRVWAVACVVAALIGIATLLWPASPTALDVLDTRRDIGPQPADTITEHTFVIVNRTPRTLRIVGFSGG